MSPASWLFVGTMILATVSLAARWWTDKRGTFTVTGWEPTVALSMSVAGVVVLVAFTVTTKRRRQAAAAIDTGDDPAT